MEDVGIAVAAKNKPKIVFLIARLFNINISLSRFIVAIKAKRLSFLLSLLITNQGEEIFRFFSKQLSFYQSLNFEFKAEKSKIKLTLLVIQYYSCRVLYGKLSNIAKKYKNHHYP